MQEQFGGGRRCATPPVELTPSRLRSKLKATARDVGLVKGASSRRQAYQNRTMGTQDPISALPGAPDLPHVVPGGTLTSETSSPMVHAASSRHASPFPAPAAPAQLQDVFFGSMDQQRAWIDSNSDAFSMMGSESFLAGGSQNHLTAQGMERLAPPPSYTFPASQYPSGFTEDFSGEASPFILQPVPLSSSSHDHPLPLPTTNVIPPTPFKDGGSQTNTTTSTNTIGTLLSGSSSQMDLEGYPSASHERFPEEHEPVTHQEGLTVTGRRSAELNAALEAGFAAVERCFLELSASTTLPTSQLINLFLKSRGRTVNGTNYWNLYANYFKEHVQTELARIGREAPAGGGTPSRYPANARGGITPRIFASTIAQRGQGFQKHYRRVIQILESAAVKFGFEAAVVLCGKVVNEDGSLGHSYNTPGAVGFWETRCRASDDAIVGHLKAHVYNSTSLTAVDDAFNDGTRNDPSTPNSTLNHDRDQSQAPEGRDDGLKWIKLELIRQVAQLGGKGYPAHKCLLPGEAHNENSRNKGIGALTQKEIAALVDGLKAGTMQVIKVDKVHRGFNLICRAVMASERPVITGIAPPPEWSHDGARRLFANGNTDYHGPARLQPSSAATKVKKATDKAPQAPFRPSNDDDDNDLGDDRPAVPAAPKFRKPTIRLDLPAPLPLHPFKVVVPPNPRQVKTVRKPESAAAESEVIELTSTEEKAVEESDTEYEEARGKKRKLKATNTSRALKKLASSEEKTDASKAGKKGTRAQTKPRKVPPMPTSTISPTKGGPLSPLTVGHRVWGITGTWNCGASTTSDGPSDERTKVKPRPIAKASKGKMKRVLRMAYSQSDESEVDEGKIDGGKIDEVKKIDVVVTESAGAVSPGLVNVSAESLQEGLTEVMHDDRPAGTQQEPPQITKPIEDPHDAARDS
ncbi:hypothetical protein C8R48DRAFT_679693, partial [Suillus tomentosus]